MFQSFRNLGLSLILAPAIGLAADCIIQTLDKYTNNYSCSIGTRDFSQFAVAPIVQMAGVVAEKDITVTPLGLNYDTGAGFKFTGPFTIDNNNPVRGFGITYLVQSTVNITDVHYAIAGVINKGNNPNQFVVNSYLRYDLGDTGTNATVDLLQLYLSNKVQVTSKKTSADFAGVTKVRVLYYFALSGIAGNAVTSIEHTFTPNPKP
jgi:hypothetical protein